jgi:hypothetical protein
MKSGKSIEITSVIVCDDIRREDNGKLLLLGVYVGDILLPSFPSSIALSFYATGSVKSTQACELEFKIQHGLSNGKNPGASAKVTAEGGVVGDTGVIALPRVPFNFDEPTELVFSILEGKDEWRIVERKRIKLREQAISST